MLDPPNQHFTSFMYVKDGPGVEWYITTFRRLRLIGPVRITQKEVRLKYRKSEVLRTIGETFRKD